MRKKYSVEDLAGIASKYDTPKELRKNNPSAYQAIIQRGLLQKLYKTARIKRKLTNETIEIIARGYNTRKDFMNGDNSAYVVARVRGILDKVCAHMTPLGDSFHRKIYAFIFF